MTQAAAAAAAGTLEVAALAPASAADDPVSARLLHAAAEVFAEKGYDGARVGEIARRAGLTTGAIYANFSGKAELLLEAIRHISETELDALVAVIAAGTPGLDAIVTMGSELAARDRDGQEPLLLEALVAVRRDPDVRDAMCALVEQREKLFGALVEHARANGEVDDSVDTRTVTRFSFALAFGFLLFEALELDHPDPASWSALLQRLVDSLRPVSAETNKTDPEGEKP